MNSLLRRIVLPLLVAPALAGVLAAQSIPWAKGLDEAMRTAKGRRTLVMVFLYADWCSWCQRMQSTTFQEAATIERLKKVVPVRMNIETDGAAIKKKYKVGGVPGILFLEPNGERFAALEGFAPSTLFRDEVQKYVSAFEQRPGLLAAYKRAPGDGEVNARLAWLYGIQSDLSKALPHLNVAIRAGYRGPHLARAHNMVGDVYQLSDRLPTAIEHFRKALAAAPQLEDRAYALVSLLSCYKVQRNESLIVRTARELAGLRGANPEYVAMAREELAKRGIKPD